MKIINLLNEEPKTVVRLDNLPQYKVVNPSEQEIADAAASQKTLQAIVKKGSEAEAEAEADIKKEEPKDSPKTSSSKIEAPVKNLISNLLDSLKKFISEV